MTIIKKPSINLKCKTENLVDVIDKLTLSKAQRGENIDFAGLYLNRENSSPEVKKLVALA